MSELECYLNALRKIFDITKAPYYSREARLAHAEARKALEATDRIPPSADSQGGEK